MDSIGSMEEMSDEVMEWIFYALCSARDLGRSAAVCRRWAAICARDRLWCGLWLCRVGDHCLSVNDIDLTGTARPLGYSDDSSWREVYREEMAAARFSCVHQPYTQGRPTQVGMIGCCRLCGKHISQYGPSRPEYVSCHLVGNSLVGKTFFLKQFCNGNSAGSNHVGREIEQQIQGDAPHLQTVGLDRTHSQEICCSMADGAQEVTFNLWDTAGRSLYRPLPENYYPTGAILIFFDVTRMESFQAVMSTWWPEYLRHFEADPFNTSALLVGIRQDLTTRRPREISVREAHVLARHMELERATHRNGCNHGQRVHYVEANPATGDGVQRVMATLARVRIKQREAQRDTDTAPLATLEKKEWCTVV